MKFRRPALALVLSLGFAGWGQIYDGQFLKALGLCGGWTVVNFCAIALGLQRTFAGLLLMLLADIGFYFFLAVEATAYARGLTSEGRQVTPNRWYAYLGFAAIMYVLVFSSAFAARRLFFNAYRIPNGSMEPALLIGDDIVVDIRTVASHRGDVIVFPFPPDRTKLFVKRVAGISGDTVVVRNGVVFINRSIEPYGHLDVPPSSRSPLNPRDNFGPVTVPSGKLFVLGDSRDHSYDSRFWGFVDEAEVQGHVLYVYWSENATDRSVRWNRIGTRVK